MKRIFSHLVSAVVGLCVGASGIAILEGYPYAAPVGVGCFWLLVFAMMFSFLGTTRES